MINELKRWCNGLINLIIPKVCTVCVMNDEGVKVYEDVVSSEAGGTYSFSLAGEANGQYQVVLLHRLGHLTGSFTLE